MSSILIIEDNTDINKSMARLLELAGYKTFTANNGEEGLEVAKKSKPDLVLCDIMMPNLDGYGVLRAFGNIPEMMGVPFIYMTAKTEKEDFRKGMDLGADDYLTKPFNGEDLLKIVDARLKKNKSIKEAVENNLKGSNNFNNSGKTFNNLDIASNRRIIKKIKKKDTVFMEGDLSNYLYFIKSGKIKAYKTNEWGKDYITEIYKEGDFFGYVALLDDGKHKESAMAIENSEIALISKDVFFELLHSNSDVSMRFIKFLSSNFSKMEEKLMKLIYSSARKRVADALLFISQKYQVNKGDEISFTLQRENISALAGLSPESVSRSLTEFKEEGLIETINGSIKIIDLKKLEMIKN